ncbi:MAG: glycosyl hydrolase family 8 [Solirubrobacteraceae bacterium]
MLLLSLGVTACGNSDSRARPASTAATEPASTGTSGPASPGGSAATIAAAQFINRYVASDGRVIRHDQGGDIVSEGQAYGMLIAEIAERPLLTRTVWSWTRAHLGRSDGLFAWHATGTGQIEDPHSAADADVLIAYALLRYAGPEQAAMHDAGQHVAEAVLANESVMLAGGEPLVLPGPWAKLTSPPTVDPSYLMPGVFDALARMTGDGRWGRAATAAVAVIADVTNGGKSLPPDWAQLSGDRLHPIAEPGGGAGVQYGLDAARLPLWFATACDSRARSLAASWWRNVLSTGDRSAPRALTLGGATIDPSNSALTLLAGAAAATAAGDANAAARLSGRAVALARDTPTYYGNAWAALGSALLDRSLDPCASD